MGRLRAYAKRLTPDSNDVFFVVGVAAITGGVWMLSHPVSLIVFGGILLSVASIGAWRASHAAKDGING